MPVDPNGGLATPWGAAQTAIGPPLTIWPYVAPGGPASTTIKFDHRSGLPVAPIWFGNRTTYTERGVS